MGNMSITISALCDVSLVSLFLVVCLGGCLMRKKLDLRVLRLLGSCRVSRLLSGSFDAHMTRLEVAHVLIVVWGARAGVWGVCLVCCVPGTSSTALVDLS